MVPGGRVELPTPAFSGPRSTDELPRHLCSQKIVRAGGVRVNVLEVEDQKKIRNRLPRYRIYLND